MVGGIIAGALVWGMAALSPDRQVKRVFSEFLGAASGRNWKKVGVLMAPGYRDQWGSDRERALMLGTEAFRNYLVLQIEASEVKVARQGAWATVSAHLKITGRGNAVGEMITQQVNELKGEFQFAWKRQSWKPWDWQLESISEPEIEFDPASLP